MDPEEIDGELGEGRTATNLTTAILGSRRGGKHRGGAPGLFRSCGSVRGLATRCRSSGARRRGEGVAVVMGTATMAASSARWCAREGNRRGNGVQGGERGGAGGEGVSVASRGSRGGCHGEAGGGRRSSGARHASPLPTGRGRRGQGGEVGWAGWGGWAR